MMSSPSRKGFVYEIFEQVPRRTMASRRGSFAAWSLFERSVPKAFVCCGTAEAKIWSRVIRSLNRGVLVAVINFSVQFNEHDLR